MKKFSLLAPALMIASVLPWISEANQGQQFSLRYTCKRVGEASKTNFGPSLIKVFAKNNPRGIAELLILSEITFEGRTTESIAAGKLDMNLDTTTLAVGPVPWINESGSVSLALEVPQNVEQPMTKGQLIFEGSDGSKQKGAAYSCEDSA